MAYEVLSNPDKRRLYDQAGEQGIKEGGSGGGVGGKAGAVQKCPNCRGTGMQVRIQQLGPG